jgi:hypothetical protein
MAVTGLILALGYAEAQQGERGQSSYMPVDITEAFASLMARLSAAKPSVEQEHNALLNERYDLSDRPAQDVTMDRGKPLQEGVRVKLPAGMTWERLAAMSSDQIREADLLLIPSACRNASKSTMSTQQTIAERFSASVPSSLRAIRFKLGYSALTRRSFDCDPSAGTTPSAWGQSKAHPEDWIGRA